MRQITLADSLRIIDLKRKNCSYRDMAQKVHIPKSTLHYNIEKISKTVEFLETHPNDGTKRLVETILVQTFDGRVSSRGVEAVIENLWDTSISHQTIIDILSECKKITDELNPTISLKNISPALFDEIFMKSQPILAFSDPISGLVSLNEADNRSAENWKSFLRQLKSQGLDPKTTTTDGALGLLNAIKVEFKNSINIRDIFHVLKKLSKAQKKMEQHCYRLINELEVKIKSNSNSIESLIELECKQDYAIEIYDGFETHFNSFKNGFSINNNEGMKYISSTELAWILKNIYRSISIFVSNISDQRVIKEAKTYIKGGFREILTYKKLIEDLIKEKAPTMLVKFALQYFMRISECLDQYMRSYEDKKQQVYWGKKVVTMRAETRNSPWFKDKVIDACINEYWEIYQTVAKSNSYMESVNSVIRKHLNVYNSIPEWFCSLFTYYWNHRKFKRGKRAGYSPSELHTKKKIKNKWYEPILEKFPYEKFRSQLPNSISIAA